MGSVENRIHTKKAEAQKQLAVLIDPDKTHTEAAIAKMANAAETGGADCLFIGGSLISRPGMDAFLKTLKGHTSLPCIIFPGSPLQISSEADAILFLSLISGRNPEALIGHHVIAAPYIKAAGLEALPTGYMLVDCGQTTTAQYMSNSPAIPYHKPEIAAITAMAGEMLGLRFIYLDGGSGAEKAISTAMVEEVRKNISAPIFVGGGIRTPEIAIGLTNAGADLLVIGNATEKDPGLIHEISRAIKE